MSQNQSITVDVINIQKNQRGTKITLFVPAGYPTPAVSIQTFDVEFSPASKSLGEDEEEE